MLQLFKRLIYVNSILKFGIQIFLDRTLSMMYGYETEYFLEMLKIYSLKAGAE